MQKGMKKACREEDDTGMNGHQETTENSRRPARMGRTATSKSSLNFDFVITFLAFVT